MPAKKQTKKGWLIQQPEGRKNGKPTTINERLGKKEGTRAGVHAVLQGGHYLWYATVGQSGPSQCSNSECAIMCSAVSRDNGCRGGMRLCCCMKLRPETQQSRRSSRGQIDQGGSSLYGTRMSSRNSPYWPQRYEYGRAKYWTYTGIPSERYLTWTPSLRLVLKGLCQARLSAMKQAGRDGLRASMC